ncbi:uncharacterized protein TNCV_4430441 [Trichonephila clavipes]|nr:uncharacterized protein TNCV_4430441 [Trichonephila clavipes]
MVDPPLEGKLFQNEKKIQSFHKLFSSKSPIGFDHGRTLLWRFLYWVDLLEDSNRTFLTKSLFRLLLFLLFVMHMDNIVGAVTKFSFKTDDSIFRVSILHFSCYVISASVWQIEWVLLFMNSFCGLLAILWKAGSLPIEAEKLKRTYRTKYRQKLLSENKVGELRSEIDLIDTSIFVLSGCNIIYFYRSSLLALAGTILTYTVLLMSKN